MPKKNRKRSGAVARPAPNVRLTKGRVRTAMLELRAAGAVMTSKAILKAAGGKGSFSTLIKLRREIESEEPHLIAGHEVSKDEVVHFIESCDRAVLPSLETALQKRLWKIAMWQKKLVLELDDRTGEARRVLEELQATKLSGVGWVLPFELRNFERALEKGFTARNAANIRKELADEASRTEFV